MNNNEIFNMYFGIIDDPRCEANVIHPLLDVTYDEDRCKLLTQRAQENINIFRKLGVSIHKNYLKGKKQTVKSSMFNCLLNDRNLVKILQNF